MMAENKMADVAKLLGVELGEEFLLDGDLYKVNDLVFRITNKGVEARREKGYDWSCFWGLLLDLLKGEMAIKKKPWKPKKGEKYFVPSFTKKGLFVGRRMRLER